MYFSNNVLFTLEEKKVRKKWGEDVGDH